VYHQLHTGTARSNLESWRADGVYLRLTVTSCVHLQTVFVWGPTCQNLRRQSPEGFNTNSTDVLPKAARPCTLVQLARLGVLRSSHNSRTLFLFMQSRPAPVECTGSAGANGEQSLKNSALRGKADGASG
jgi:hypothetical protein